MPKITITVPKPCHQSWQEMTTIEKGRYCSTCQKCVDDFTAMTDAQIIAYLSTAKSGVCGRYKPSQLDREINAGLVPKSGLQPRI
jgi:hypothetical protein